jgi:hypothetical protein
MTLGLGPMSIAIAPAPPVHLAGPFSYTAKSEATTIPYLPSQLGEVIQFRVLIRAFVAP